MACTSKTFEFTNDRFITDNCTPPADGERNDKGDSIVQKFYWHDTSERSMRLLGLCIGKGGHRAWVVQRRFGSTGKDRRFVIGEFPTMNLVQAKQAAAAALVEMSQGIVPTICRKDDATPAPIWETITLAEAIEEKKKDWAAQRLIKRQTLAKEKGIDVPERADESHRKIPARLQKYLIGNRPLWAGRPLIKISVAECMELFNDIATTASVKMAQNVLKHLREVWNPIREKSKDENGNYRMPASPWNRMDKPTQKRLKIDKINRTGSSIDDLPGYYSKVNALKNPIFADLKLFAVLSGHRISECKLLRWDDVLPNNTLHLYVQKIGEHCDVPVAARIVELLAARRAWNTAEFANCGGDGGWVFPRTVGSKKCSTYRVAGPRLSHQHDKLAGIHSNHRCRDTFLTIGAELGYSDAVLDKLVPHKPDSRNTTRGYQNVSMDVCRRAANAIADEIHRRMTAVQPSPMKLAI
jgi:integrase